MKAVMDILKAHPECLELNELVINAKKAIDNKEYVKADNLLEEALKSCRFILAKAKEEKIEEKPAPKVSILVWVILLLVIIGAIIPFYFMKKGKIKIFKKMEGR